MTHNAKPTRRGALLFLSVLAMTALQGGVPRPALAQAGGQPKVAPSPQKGGAGTTFNREQVARVLRQASYFSLGGVGVAGTKSEGEKALRSLLDRRDAVVLLREAFYAPDATPAGRLYALLGLRWADATGAVYRAAAGSSRGRVTGVVRTMNGCLASDRPAAEVAAEIGKGIYDKAKSPA